MSFIGLKEAIGETERIQDTLETSGGGSLWGGEPTYAARTPGDVPSVVASPDTPPVETEQPLGVPVVESVPPEPTPAVSPESTPSTYAGGVRADLAALVSATFPDDSRMATHVVWAESIGDWNKNWECTVYGGCWSVTNDCGLLQIHWAAHYDKFWRRGWTEADCWIPERNLEIAREVYDASGGTAWTTY